jgi:hypothetical protein
MAKAPVWSSAMSSTSGDPSGLRAAAQPEDQRLDGDTTDRLLLEKLQVADYDHVIALL